MSIADIKFSDEGELATYEEQRLTDGASTSIRVAFELETAENKPRGALPLPLACCADGSNSRSHLRLLFCWGQPSL